MRNHVQQSHVRATHVTCQTCPPLSLALTDHLIQILTCFWVPGQTTATASLDSRCSTISGEQRERSHNFKSVSVVDVITKAVRECPGQRSNPKASTLGALFVVLFWEPTGLPDILGNKSIPHFINYLTFRSPLMGKWIDYIPYTYVDCKLGQSIQGLLFGSAHILCP